MLPFHLAAKLCSSYEISPKFIVTAGGPILEKTIFEPSSSAIKVVEAFLKQTNRTPSHDQKIELDEMLAHYMFETQSQD